MTAGILTAGLVQAQDREAAAVFSAAEQAQSSGDAVRALLLYARASDLEPANETFSERLRAMQAIVNALAATRVTDSYAARDRDAATLLAEGVPLSDLYGGRPADAPPRLRDTGLRNSFDLRGTGRILIEQVAMRFGLLATFEREFNPTDPVIYRVESATMAEALRVLETVTNSFFVPLAEDRFIVYRDTTQNRADHDPVVTALIPVPERISLQEAQEMASGIQQTMEIRRIAVDGPRRVIYLRDEESKILAARKILSDLSRPRAQVMIDIELLTAIKSSSLAYGMSLPTSAPIVNFGDFLSNTPATPMGYNNYGTFGGGTTFFGVGIADANAFANLSRSSARILLATQLVALDGQQATLNIGTRFPVVVGRFGDPNDPALSTPQTQYIDLGFQITVKPVVHDGEITLDLDADYNELTGAQNDGIPIIAQRSFQGITRIQTGEWAVLSGLVQSQVTDASSGIPILSQIPWIGHLFRDNTRFRDTSEILLVIKPRLLRSGPWEEPTTPVYTGTETKPPSQF